VYNGDYSYNKIKELRKSSRSVPESSVLPLDDRAAFHISGYKSILCNCRFFCCYLAILRTYQKPWNRKLIIPDFLWAVKNDFLILTYGLSLLYGYELLYTRPIAL